MLYHSKYEAIKAQFVTAIAAFIGTAVGLMVERNRVAEDILLSVTSGGFVYIACVGMLPKLLSSSHSSGWQIVLEGIAFLLGVSLMVVVLLFEQHEHEH